MNFLRITRRRDRERGAALIEMALITPLLVLLLLGIIEFGYLFAQYNEIRHAAREGARYAAVSQPDHNGDGITGDNADVIDVVCDALNLPGASILVTLSGDDADGDGTLERLEEGTLTVEADVSSLSGAPLITTFLPGDLANTATFRLEQEAQWTNFTDEPCL